MTEPCFVTPVVDPDKPGTSAKDAFFEGAIPFFGGPETGFFPDPGKNPAWSLQQFTLGAGAGVFAGTDAFELMVVGPNDFNSVNLKAILAVNGVGELDSDDVPSLISGAPVFLCYEGGSDKDFVVGGTNFDELFGNNGNDTLKGEEGDDFLDGGRGDDDLFGGDDDDQILGGAGFDEIFGGDGDDTIDGGNQNDTIDGGDGDDDIHGGNGNDVIDGGKGDDEISGGNGRDSIAGGDGNDSVDGGNQNDTIDGGKGEDVLLGGAGNDHIKGGGQGDLLLGQEGNDKLFGNGGSDTLVGGEGNDQLNGGGGADVFVWEHDFSMGDAPNQGIDTIKGFSLLQGDMIDLTCLSFDGPNDGSVLDLDIIKAIRVNANTGILQLFDAGEDAGKTFDDTLIGQINIKGAGAGDLVEDDSSYGSSMSSITARGVIVDLPTNDDFEIPGFLIS